MATIPRHPDEFSTDWLESVLKAPEGSIRGFTAEPVGTGQVAASYRLQLDRPADHGPKSYVVKAPSADETSWQVGKDHNLYAREVTWYEEMAPKAAIRCPACHRSLLNNEAGEFLLFLEDCAPAVQGDQLAGASVAEIEAGLNEAARLHAPFWNNPGLAADPLFVPTPEQTDLRIEQFKHFWPSFRERYTGRLDPDLLEMGEAFAARFESFSRQVPSALSLVHGDFRIDNMLFGSPDGRVVVLDWQTVALGPPAADVAYFIGTSFADPGKRGQEEQALFAHYIDELEGLGVAPDPEALWRDFRIQAFSGLVMAIMASMSVVRTERGDEMFAVMAERHGKQALDLDSLSLI